jgi:hypothetical protein
MARGVQFNPGSHPASAKMSIDESAEGGFEVRSYLFVPVEELAIISSDEVFPNRTIVQCAKE